MLHEPNTESKMKLRSGMGGFKRVLGRGSIPEYHSHNPVVRELGDSRELNWGRRRRWSFQRVRDDWGGYPHLRPASSYKRRRNN